MNARKRFGQHFLTDAYCLQQLQGFINPEPNDHIIEIGPGRGALTQQLVGLCRTLDLIEIDRDLIPILLRRFGNQVQLHEADALKFDLRKLSHHNALRIVGNLPYNISTPLIFHFFNYLDMIEDMHFLLQKEVVDRITAPPGSRTYGRLSIKAQYYCDATPLLTVGPELFEPKPKVNSAFLRLTPKQPLLLIQSMSQFDNLVQQAFSQRRKTLRNSLKQWISAEKLKSLDIDPEARPETLKVVDFVRISNAI